MKSHCYLLPLLSLLLIAPAVAQTPIPLWSEDVPGALGKQDQDNPTLTPYLADSANAAGAAMVILPGGGYGALAPHGGKGYADWLVTNGVSGFVVKYRLGSHAYRHTR